MEREWTILKVSGLRPFPNFISPHAPSNANVLGKSAIKAPLSPAYAKLFSVPNVRPESEAQTLLHSIIPYTSFLRVERGAPSGSSSSSLKHLAVVHSQIFTPAEYYAWLYEGSQWTTYAGGVIMVAVMLGGVMLPLWHT
jgi:translocation protein SEC62